MKNFWFTTITAVANKSWIIPCATWFFARISGSGQFHIICPIDTYIIGISRQTDAISRFFIFGVSWSFNKSSAALPILSALLAFPVLPSPVFPSAPPLFSAPYPALVTAAITASASACPSTPMELVRRLTEQEVTPGTLDTAFSTRALQAAQLIPVTVYCSIYLSTSVYLS